MDILNLRNIQINCVNKNFSFSKQLVEGTNICLGRFKKGNVKRGLTISRFWQVQMLRVGARFLFLKKSNFESFNRVVFFFKRRWVHLFFSFLKTGLYGLNKNYYMRFSTVGYNFKFIVIRRRLSASYKRRERVGRFLMLRIGYCYRFCVKLPHSVRIYKRSRRALTLAGANARVFYFLVTYIRNIHNLFPYKRKGFAFRSEKMVMKQGKKTRFR